MATPQINNPPTAADWELIRLIAQHIVDYGTGPAVDLEIPGVGGTRPSLAQIEAVVDALRNGDFLASVNAIKAAVHGDADRAESARDASIVNAETYADEPEGRAAVANGETFDVQGSGPVAVTRYRRIDANTSVQIATIASSEAPAFRGFDIPDESVAIGFADKLRRLMGYFDSEGKLHARPSDDLVRSVNYLREATTSDFLLLVDAEGKAVYQFGVDGLRYKGRPIEAGAASTGSAVDAIKKVPIKSFDQTLAVTQLQLVEAQIEFQTVAQGKTSDPDKALDSSGMTHPSVVYVPGGWNGYEYWIAATPFFGPIGGNDNYENPHVFATNSLESWADEPAGGRIDNPEGGDYWSDTHLQLGDDGCMHLFYRGVGFTYGSIVWVHRESWDGVTWTDPTVILNADDPDFSGFDGYLSPAFYKNGSKWICYAIFKNTEEVGWAESPTTGDRHIVKLVANEPGGDYSPIVESAAVIHRSREWGLDAAPWHMDACQIGNITLHVYAVGPAGQNTSEWLYLAWSADGRNFTVLPQLEVGDNVYRSSIVPKSVTEDRIIADLVVAKKDGKLSLYEITLEVS